MSQILIIDPDHATCRWLESVLERDGFTVDIVNTGEDALNKIAQEPPKVLVLEVALPDVDGIELIRRVRQDPSTNGMGIVVLSSKLKITEIQAGLDAGADEYIAKRPGVDIELGPKIRSLANRERAQIPPSAIRGNGQEHRGKIISFCSAKGGTGTTFVCVNAAYALARLQIREKTLAVDMVFPLGMVGPSVGYESPQTIARLTQVLKGNIKTDTVKVFVSADPEYGFYILLGANNLKEANALDPSQIGALFETLRQMYDYILVDFGRMLSCFSLPVIETSDAVVLVLTPDPYTVKTTKLVLQDFESLGIQRQRIVLVNNRGMGRAWMSREEIENELGHALATSIPNELENVTAALNAGLPFMAKFPERPASLAIGDFTRALLERVPK